MERKKAIELGIVIGLVIIGAFLRLYRLRETVVFQGDQGRDAIVVKRLIKDFDLVLLGPVTSVGNMYLGPFYYYFMAPWLWLSYPDPIGPAYGIALTSILSLPLFYFLGKKMTGTAASLIGLVLLVFSEPLILYSRFSWNPNLAPLVALLTGWALFQVMEGKYRYFIWAFVGLSVLTQLHYVAMIMLPVTLSVMLLVWRKHQSNKIALLKPMLGGIVVYALSWLPLLVFDATHQGLIRQSFLKFLTSSEEHLQPATQILGIVKDFEGRGLHLLTQLMGVESYVWGRLLLYGTILWLGTTIWMGRKSARSQGMTLTIIILLWTIGATALYSGSLFDHYLLFAVPFVAMFWGLVGQRLWEAHVLGKGLVVGLLALYVAINLPRTAAFAVAGPSLEMYKDTAQAVLPYLSGGPYNLALLSESRDYKGMNYRYYFEISNEPPESPDLYYDLDQLVVIDEIKTIAPLDELIYEIQRPGLSHLAEQLTFPNGLKVYIYE